MCASVKRNLAYLHNIVVLRAIEPGDTYADFLLRRVRLYVRFFVWGNAADVKTDYLQITSYRTGAAIAGLPYMMINTLTSY